jgi:outer membrane protein assembly factor BamB
VIQDLSENGTSDRRVRWWPLILIFLMTFAGLIVIQRWPELSNQQRNLFTVQTAAVSLLLVLFWILFFSRARWWARLFWFSMMIGSLAAAAGMFRIRGVSGDLLPIFEWRFKEPRTTTLLEQPAQDRTTPAQAGADRALSNGHDYPQFLGAGRDGKVEGAALARDWDTFSPELQWRRSVGAGWSGFAVSRNRAITQEQNGEEEQVVCYDLTSGQVVWTHGYPARYQTVIAGEGPRATPSISGERVFTMGATGILTCLDFASGELVWSKDVVAEIEGRAGEWGVSCSPLVEGSLVVVSTGAKDGRSLAAYDIATGKLAWTTGNDQASYSSPGIGSLGGARQIYMLNSRTVAGHDPVTGAQLWSHPWLNPHPNVTTPLVLGEDKLLISAGYGAGSELLEIKQVEPGQWDARRVWKSIRLKSKFANMVCWEGFVYGLDDGVMVCIDPATGQALWKDGRYGHGQMILSSGLILLTAENGDVALIEPGPEKLRELSRFKALRGKTWNPPALAGPFLIVRNDQEAACFRLPIQPH